MVGEGPGLDAHATGRPVLVTGPRRRPDVTLAGTSCRACCSTGVRGVFSFPLRVAAVRLGALDLSRDAPGPLDAVHSSATRAVMAEVVTRRFLAEPGRRRPAGALGADLDDPIALRLEVHQAAGMVSEQLDIRAADALVLLRAAAYASERPIDDARARRRHPTLRFDDDPV